MEWENDILIVIIYENEVQKMCVEQYDKKTLIDLKKIPWRWHLNTWLSWSNGKCWQTFHLLGLRNLT